MRIEDDQYVMLLGDYTKWLSQTALPTAFDRFGANQPRKGAIFKLTIEQVCLTTSLRKNGMPAQICAHRCICEFSYNVR